MKQLLCLLLVTLLTSSAAFAQEQGSTVSIVRVQHRDADSVRQAIVPLLAQGGSIGQIDNALIIATNRQNLAMLQGLISELDIPRRNLVVSVDFNYQENRQSTGTSVFTDLSTRAPEISRIRLLEGEQALIEQSTHSVSTGTSLLNPGLTVTAASNTSDRVFSIRAEVRDRQVLLDIETWQSVSTGNNTEQQRVSTRVTATPGEWIVLNPEAEAIEPAQEESETQASLSTLLTTRQQQNTLAISVELQP